MLIDRLWGRRLLEFFVYIYFVWDYSDGKIIIIIIIGFLVYGLSWFCVGYVGITLVVLVLRRLRWYFVGSVGITLVVIPSLYVDGK